jgi:hypothetical protein
MFRTEWGAPTPTPLSWFRGKPNLPAGPQISFSQFYGKSNIAVTLPNISIENTEFLGGTSNCNMRLNNNGTYQAFSGLELVAVGSFVSPASLVTQLEVRATIITAPVGASWSGSAFNTWLSLGPREWTLSRNSIGFSTAVFRLEFRIVGKTEIIHIAVIDMSVNVEDI